MPIRELEIQFLKPPYIAGFCRYAILNGVITVVHAEVTSYGDIVSIALKGEFFLGNIMQVESAWDQEVTKNPRVIAIDCKELSFVDSSAIGSLVKFLNISHQKNFELIFVEVSENILKIFDKAKLNRVFTIKSREDFEEHYVRK